MGCKFANQVIVISSVINTMIQQKYGRMDACLIPNGVPAPIITADTAYLSTLGVEARKFVFAMGRFVPEKNLHLLIKAFADLQPVGYKLVIAGDADIEDAYSKELKQLAKNNGVILTGFIKGMPLYTLLSHARLFVIPSSHEGLPIALLEAMSYGLPVLASDIPAKKEIGLPLSSYFQYDENMLANLTRALRNKLDDAAIPEYDMSRYNWDFIAQQTIAAYEKALNSQFP